MLTTIIVDASYCSEYNVGGYGYWMVNNNGKRSGGGMFKVPVYDSNVCEYLACVNGIHVAKLAGFLSVGDKVILQTDNTFAISMFRAEPESGIGCSKICVNARTLVKALLSELELTLAIRHVKGHTSNTDKRSQAQAHCDDRAYRYMIKARKSAKRAAASA